MLSIPTLWQKPPPRYHQVTFLSPNLRPYLWVLALSFWYYMFFKRIV